MAEGQTPGLGDEWNGYVWMGSAWVPRIDGSGRVFDGVGWTGGPSAGQRAAASQPPAMFAHPHYAYGLTRQTSDDLQFVVRFAKIMIIVWLVLLALSIIPLTLLLGSLAALVPR